MQFGCRRPIGIDQIGASCCRSTNTADSHHPLNGGGWWGHAACTVLVAGGGAGVGRERSATAL